MYYQIDIKFRMEMGNMSKRQQPYQRTENSRNRKATNGSSIQRENPAPEGGLQLAHK